MEHTHWVGLPHVELAKESQNLRKMSIEFSRARYTCHSPDKMLFRTQKSFQTRLNSPLQRFKSKVLLASDSPLPPSLAIFIQCWSTTQPAHDPTQRHSWALPSPPNYDGISVHTVSASSKQQQLSKLSTTKWRVWLNQLKLEVNEARAKSPIWTHSFYHMSCKVTTLNSSYLPSELMKMIMDWVGQKCTIPSASICIPSSPKAVLKV